MCANLEMSRIFQVMFIIIILFMRITRASAAIEQERYFKVGGIFDNDQEEQEIAFRSAIDLLNRRNKDQAIAIRLEPAVYRVSSSNALEVSSVACSLLGLEIVGLFGPSSLRTSKYVQAVCDDKEMPHVESHWHGDARRNNLVNVHPSPPKLEDLVVAILERYGWNKFTIVYDGNRSLMKIDKLITYKRNEYTVKLRQINANGNHRLALTQMKRLGDDHFVLVCETDTVLTFFEQAQQVGLLTEHHHYFIYNLDSHTVDMEPYRYGGSNITTVRFFDPDNPDVVKIRKHLAKISHGKQPRGLSVKFETALIYDAVQLFYQALNDATTSGYLTPRPLYCESDNVWEQGFSILNYMRMKDIDGITGKVEFDTQGFRSSFDVEIVELTPAGWKKIGTYDASQQLRINREISSDITNTDDGTLRNKTFTIITALTAPYGFLKETTTQLYGNDRFEGFGVDLIHELSLMLGFNYTFIIQEDGSNGNLDRRTGKWTGMVGAIIDEKADWAIADLTITSERESAVDFTLPFMTLGISVLYRKPKPVPPSLFMFTSPFSGQVWMLLGVAYVFVSLSLFVLGRVSPSEWTNPYPCVDDPEHLVNQFSLKNSLWFAVGSLMQQGTEIAPIGISTRMLAGVWWFFTLIMVSSYTANLAAFLTVETLVTPFKNIEELANQKEIKYGAKSNGATANFFRDSDRDTYKKIWRHMYKNPDLMTNDNLEGVTRVENENYAFLMESTSIEYVMEKNCSLTQVGQRLDDKGYGIAMKKGSWYRQMLNSAILRLQENGKITTLKIKWWKEKNSGNCDAVTSKGAVTPLNLQNVGGVFLVLGVGTFLGLCTTFLEIALQSYRRSKRRETKFKKEIEKEMNVLVKFRRSVIPVDRTPEENTPEPRLPSLMNNRNCLDNYYNESRRT